MKACALFLQPGFRLVLYAIHLPPAESIGMHFTVVNFAKRDLLSIDSSHLHGKPVQVCALFELFHRFLRKWCASAAAGSPQITQLLPRTFLVSLFHHIWFRETQQQQKRARQKMGL